MLFTQHDFEWKISTEREREDVLHPLKKAKIDEIMVLSDWNIALSGRRAQCGSDRLCRLGCIGELRRCCLQFVACISELSFSITPLLFGCFAFQRFSVDVQGFQIPFDYIDVSV